MVTTEETIRYDNGHRVSFHENQAVFIDSNSELRLTLDDGPRSPSDSISEKKEAVP